MPMTNRDFAEAFSGHAFASAFPALAEHVRWNLIGADALVGKAAVVAACEGTLAGLAGVETTFEEFKVVDGGDALVVHSVGRYVGDEGTSRVASCDLYDFTDRVITAMTSYTVELEA